MTAHRELIHLADIDSHIHRNVQNERVVFGRSLLHSSTSARRAIVLSRSVGVTIQIDFAFDGVIPLVQGQTLPARVNDLETGAHII